MYRETAEPKYMRVKEIRIRDSSGNFKKNLASRSPLGNKFLNIGSNPFQRVEAHKNSLVTGGQ